MKIAIHQPNFIPWYPFFQKVKEAAVLIPPLRDRLVELLIVLYPLSALEVLNIFPDRLPKAKTENAPQSFGLHSPRAESYL